MDISCLHKWRTKLTNETHNHNPKYIRIIFELKIFAYITVCLLVKKGY
jgi:hypothetical protein